MEFTINRGKRVRFPFVGRSSLSPGSQCSLLLLVLPAHGFEECTTHIVSGEVRPVTGWYVITIIWSPGFSLQHLEPATRTIHLVQFLNPYRWYAPSTTQEWSPPVSCVCFSYQCNIVLSRVRYRSGKKTTNLPSRQASPLGRGQRDIEWRISILSFSSPVGIRLRLGCVSPSHAVHLHSTCSGTVRK